MDSGLLNYFDLLFVETSSQLVLFPKMFAVLTVVSCGAYISKEIYEVWKETHKESADWVRKHSFVRPEAYDNYPDLSLHNSLMAANLTPEIYEVLK